MTGLAEGIEEVPMASCFPLEYNLDLLHGGTTLCVHVLVCVIVSPKVYMLFDKVRV